MIALLSFELLGEPEPIEILVAHLVDAHPGDVVELVHADSIHTCIVAETCIKSNELAMVQVVRYREADKG